MPNGAWCFCYSGWVRGWILLAACCSLVSCDEKRNQLIGAQLVEAGGGSVQVLVASAHAKAKTEGRRLVVYVGASWCEPCTYFVEAIHANQLPKEFVDLRFLKFDYDKDEERLGVAGFGGQMLPRFVVPQADGIASEHRFEGSIKGPDAMADLVPKLKAILVF